MSLFASKFNSKFQGTILPSEGRHPAKKGSRRLRRRTQRGVALVTSFMLLSMLTLGMLAYLGNATQTTRQARRQTLEVQTTHLCEAGIQDELLALWRPFKSTQNFTAL